MTRFDDSTTRSPHRRTDTSPRTTRLLASAIVLALGIITLVLIWLHDRSGPSAIKLYMRVLVSLIAISFIAFGGMGCYQNVMARDGDYELFETPIDQFEDWKSQLPPEHGYNCPKCGGALDEDAKVSPLGDVMCGYCDSWFNIHKRRRR